MRLPSLSAAICNSPSSSPLPKGISGLKRSGKPALASMCQGLPAQMKHEDVYLGIPPEGHWRDRAENSASRRVSDGSIETWERSMLRSMVPSSCRSSPPHVSKLGGEGSPLPSLSKISAKLARSISPLEEAEKKKGERIAVPLTSSVPAVHTVSVREVGRVRAHTPLKDIEFVTSEIDVGHNGGDSRKGSTISYGQTFTGAESGAFNPAHPRTSTPLMQNEVAGRALTMREQCLSPNEELTSIMEHLARKKRLAKNKKVSLDDCEESWAAKNARMEGVRQQNRYTPSPIRDGLRRPQTPLREDELARWAENYQKTIMANISRREAESEWRAMQREEEREKDYEKKCKEQREELLQIVMMYREWMKSEVRSLVREEIMSALGRGGVDERMRDMYVASRNGDHDSSRQQEGWWEGGAGEVEEGDLGARMGKTEERMRQVLEEQYKKRKREEQEVEKEELQRGRDRKRWVHEADGMGREVNLEGRMPDSYGGSWRGRGDSNGRSSASDGASSGSASRGSSGSSSGASNGGSGRRKERKIEEIRFTQYTKPQYK